ncbi:hypothetical protein PR202_ga19006 [Eleusine coracana subsp. coracana]|uniref:Uncharacterized protein n=1 Tax=Eleusine coracana subsp. coracana TaxID=191504 RepID=A0AAV5CT59_ELECO|nr:hypothetical protein PR202_ga19006 [Eleusine coracana subsp. coracana]
MALPGVPPATSGARVGGGFRLDLAVEDPARATDPPPYRVGGEVALNDGGGEGTSGGARLRAEERVWAALAAGEREGCGRHSLKGERKGAGGGACYRGERVRVAVLAPGEREDVGEVQGADGSGGRPAGLRAGEEEGGGERRGKKVAAGMAGWRWREKGRKEK